MLEGDVRLDHLALGGEPFFEARPHEAVETEALSQVTIIAIVRDRLDALLSEPLADVLEREAGERAALQRRLRR